MSGAAPLAFLSLSFGEMLVIGTVALLVFGGRLPEAMRNLGRAYGRFRHSLHELSRPIREELHRVDAEIPRRPLDIEPHRPPGPRYETQRPSPRPPLPGAPPPLPLPRTPPTSGGAADEPPPV